MNRRGFFKRLGQTAVGAVVAAKVAPVEFKHAEFVGEFTIGQLDRSTFPFWQSTLPPASQCSVLTSKTIKDAYEKLLRESE